LEESSDDEEDMLDKAWGLEQRSRLSCQLRNLSNDITIQFPRYTINMVSELHPSKHNLDAEDKKSLSKDDFSVSSSAVSHLVEMMKSNPGSNGIRISLKDSGCSGYAYNLDYVKDEDPNDYHGNFSGVDVYIKDTSLIFLKGTELDFIQEGVNHNLVFKNPNVENECGCGESFTFSNKPFAELK
jgi:iron-sulfur cluster assembly protein